MTIFEFSIPAGKDQRFAPEACRHQIGGSIPVNTPDGGRTTGRILDAKPNEDGTALLVTVETEETPDV